MPRPLFKDAETVEKSREWNTGFRNGRKAAQIVAANGWSPDRGYHLIDLPDYILKSPDDDIHSAYGMGFDLGLGETLKEHGR